MIWCVEFGTIFNSISNFKKKKLIIYQPFYILLEDIVKSSFDPS